MYKKTYGFPKEQPVTTKKIEKPTQIAKEVDSPLFLAEDSKLVENIKISNLNEDLFLDVLAAENLSFDAR